MNSVATKEKAVRKRERRRRGGKEGKEGKQWVKRALKGVNYKRFTHHHCSSKRSERNEVVLSLKKTLLHLCRNATQEPRRNFLTHSYSYNIHS